ncbi:ParB/RepB/Spo0J family partition protein [Rhodopirellula europaea]|uniref:Chromosome (Plasmid) partitioning protein ParB/stage 0 sporulation protein n=1 Tax=Rhodopirellula europaea 6C TaxID=1263867 RepID=M2A4U0_9BACT|nr:ParB N-terminal domain-containing protein [Rhodopirellula europaea]EMB14851.1 chromosome (plasmid) partitioning protein ParB/stage 0 sporulation protein [Rhodopirellula europaea 6C]
MNELKTGKVPLANIVEGVQPRHAIKPDAITRMEQSLANIGQLSPIGLEYIGEKTYRLVYGNTRFHAAKGVGWDWINALVMPKQAKAGAALRMAVSENTVREQMTFVEMADAIVEYAKQTGQPLTAAGKELGFKQSPISKCLRIDKCVTPANKRRLLEAGFGGSHAYYVSQVKDEKEQTEMVTKAIEEKWSRRDFERYLKGSRKPVTRLRLHVKNSLVAIDVPKGTTGEELIEVIRELTTDLKKHVAAAHTPETIAQIYA